MKKEADPKVRRKDEDIKINILRFNFTIKTVYSRGLTSF